MAFFGLFKSNSTREAELKLRVRQAAAKIEQFIRQLKSQAKQYENLARKAFNLGDEIHLREMGMRYFKCLNTVNHWQRYQVKLNAMELQRNEVKTTKEFLTGMNSLTSSILNGVNPEEIAKVANDMERAQFKCEELEQTLAIAMNDHAGIASDVDQFGESIQFEFAEDSKLESPESNRPKIKAVADDKQNDSQPTETEFWKAIEGLRLSLKE